MAQESGKIEAPAAAAIRLVLIYAAFAALWIFVSDTAVEALVRDPAHMVRAEMIKGWLFVAVTSLLLYGMVSRLLITTRDARRLEQEALDDGTRLKAEVAREREHRLALASHCATMIEKARDIVLLIDSDGRIVEANRAAEEAYGWNRDELRSMTVRDLRAPESLAEVERQWQQAASPDGTLFEARHRHRDGRLFPVEVSSRAIEIEGNLYRQSFVRDISARKQAEAALRESEQLYHTVVDIVSEVIFQTDVGGRWTFLNAAWTEVTGFAVSESLGRPVLDYVYPEDRQRSQELFESQIRHQKDYCRHEIRYRHKDGGFRWIEVHARLTLDDAGNIVGTAGALSDVSERKLAEDELIQRNADLERFNRASVDRELDMIALKERINMLSTELGRAPPFDLRAHDVA